jgi:hypothetical protein
MGNTELSNGTISLRCLGQKFIYDQSINDDFPTLIKTNDLTHNAKPKLTYIKAKN